MSIVNDNSNLLDEKHDMNVEQNASYSQSQHLQAGNMICDGKMEKILLVWSFYLTFEIMWCNIFLAYIRYCAEHLFVRIERVK